MNLMDTTTVSNRHYGIVLGAILLSSTIFVSTEGRADHVNNESARTVDMPTVIKPPKEDNFPKIELLGYKICSGGVTVSLRATDESRYQVLKKDGKTPQSQS